MTYLKFKQYLKEYCKDRKINLPLINERHKLHRSYENSLWTAPLLDDEETLEQFLRNTNWTDVFNKNIEDKYDCLAPLPKAVPVPEYTKAIWGISNIKEEGKTPMRNYNDAYASASVTTTKSDTAVQRDYLISRLESLQYPKDKELQKVFNLYVDSSPRTYKELIDVIKNGKYTIDPKIAKRIDAAEAEDDDMELNNGPFYGIIWEGPSPDWKGYKAALEDRNQQAAKARDIIMSGVYADGLKALQDFEAWLPTPAVTTTSA